MTDGNNIQYRLNIDAIVLSYRRAKLLDRVISGLKKQCMIRNIHVFHNAPSSREIAGVNNIFSGRNFGCLARHALSLLIDADYILFVDDDTELLVDFSERFLSGIKQAPNSILGLFGVNVYTDECGKALYRSDLGFLSSNFFRYVDITVGRVLLCKRNWFPHLFTIPFYINYPLSEDVMLNLSVQMALSAPSAIIPSWPFEHLLLSREHAVSSRSTHSAERTEIIRRFIAKGWTSFLQNRVYRNHNHFHEEKDNSVQLEMSRIQTLIAAGDIAAVQEQKICAAIINIVDYAPSALRLLYSLGSLYLENNMKAEAEAIYRNIISEYGHADPKLSGLAHFKLALTLIEQKGLNDKAAFHLEECLRHYPEHIKARQMLKDPGI